MADIDDMEVSPGMQDDESTVLDKHILVQFKNEAGDVLGSPFDMPANLSKERLQRLCDALLQKVDGSGVIKIDGVPAIIMFFF